MPRTKTQPADGNKTIWVAIGEPVGVRSPGVTELKVDDLAVNVNLFMSQMGEVLDKTPEKLGKFHLDEFEITAEVSAEGQLVLLGAGGKAGITGGIKFVFKRSPA